MFSCQHAVRAALASVPRAFSNRGIVSIKKKPVVSSDTTQIHRWAKRESDQLTMRFGTEKSIADVLGSQKFTVPEIKEYVAMGKIVCKPEDSEGQFAQRLATACVPEDTITAWTQGLSRIKESFETNHGYNVTGNSVTGIFRGAMQVTMNPDGYHELFYNIAGIEFVTTNNIKEFKEEVIRTPVMGERCVTVKVKKAGFLREYEEDEVKMVPCILEWKTETKQIPVFYTSDIERDVYEALMDIVTRDATHKFAEQYPVHKLSDIPQGCGVKPLHVGSEELLAGVTLLVSAAFVPIIIFADSVEAWDMKVTKPRFASGEESSLVNVHTIEGRKDFEIPEWAADSYGGMQAIQMKDGIEGDDILQVLTVLYDITDIEFKDERVKRHPDWKEGGTGFKHVMWVPQADIAKLVAAYQTNHFKRWRLELQEKKGRRAPRLTFHTEAKQA